MNAVDQDDASFLLLGHQDTRDGPEIRCYLQKPAGGAFGAFVNLSGQEKSASISKATDDRQAYVRDVVAKSGVTSLCLGVVDQQDSHPWDAINHFNNQKRAGQNPAVITRVLFLLCKRKNEKNQTKLKQKESAVNQASRLLVLTFQEYGSIRMTSSLFLSWVACLGRGFILRRNIAPIIKPEGSDDLAGKSRAAHARRFAPPYPARHSPFYQ